MLLGNAIDYLLCLLKTVGHHVMQVDSSRITRFSKRLHGVRFYNWFFACQEGEIWLVIADNAGVRRLAHWGVVLILLLALLGLLLILSLQKLFVGMVHPGLAFSLLYLIHFAEIAIVMIFEFDVMHSQLLSRRNGGILDD
jgi:hypothetical protein